MLFYLIVVVILSALYIQPVKKYEYICSTRSTKILTGGSPLCFYNCPKGYVNLRMDGYQDNSIHYYIDNKNITMNEVIKFYYEFLKQDIIYIEMNGSSISKPAFGYFIVMDGKETKLFVPFERFPKYKDIKLLIQNRYMLDLYYPVCSYYNNMNIGLTIKKEKKFFKSKSRILLYDKISSIFDISTYYATLENKVAK